MLISKNCESKNLKNVEMKVFNKNDRKASSIKKSGMISEGDVHRLYKNT